MKKIIYLFSAAVCIHFSAGAQNAVPNGNFEGWTTSNYDEPSFFTSSNLQTFNKCSSVFNVLKVTDPQHGSYAIQLNTLTNGSDTCMGFAVNASNPNGGNPCQWQGGTPYTQVPAGLKGYYKSNSMPGDSGGILVAFKNAGNCLGLYMMKLGGVHTSAYVPFTLLFNPPIAGTPDTMLFAAISSDVFNNIAIPGSMLQLDSISFIGVSQPANFNGDFELWQPKSIEVPNSWYVNGGGQNGSGVAKTTDKQAGLYAAQMTSTQGDRNGVPCNNGASVSTGYWPQNCSGMCTQMGGWPFSNQNDSLCFYYKYSPVNNDTAEVNLSFKKFGANVFNTWQKIYGTTSTYQFMKVPFNIGSSIDSVIVSFSSSLQNDSSVAYIGSVLKVDEVHFGSQAIGIKTYDASVGVKVFPNPSATGDFVVSNVNRYDLVRVINVFGQEVNASIVKENGLAKIHVATAGAYFVYINAEGRTSMLKVIVGNE